MATVPLNRPLRRGAMNSQGALYDFLFNVKEIVNALHPYVGLSLEPSSAPTLPAGAPLALAAATTLTAATHSNRTLLLTGSGSSLAQVLPAATGSGARYFFIVGTVNTSNHVIKVTTDDVMKGLVSILDNDSNAMTGYSASGTDDTITLNGTTTGGQIGDWVEFQDIAANTWMVRGGVVCPAGSNVADMFSATVT